MNQQKIEAMTPLEMNPEVRDAMSEIAVLTKQEVARVPEPVFRQALLPILTNVNEGNVDITPWQDLAGTVTRPIDVIDGAGNVLFRVPGLFQTIPTGSNGSVRDSWNEILQQTKLRTEQHPRVGQTYFETKAASKLPQVEASLERLRQWNVVLAYYNLPLLPIGVAAGGDETASAAVTDLSNAFTGEDDAL